MTIGGETYLAIILAAFLIYAATLFWAMVTNSGAPPPSMSDTRPNGR